mmetsp:Transcript_93811/g.242384  ORF Transcript_93811/g.242384 Transcript_93811/m.242384 type:complete len:312 (+) Transcript_93811:507-1442(+)
MRRGISRRATCTTSSELTTSRSRLRTASSRTSTRIKRARWTGTSLSVFFARTSSRSGAAPSRCPRTQAARRPSTTCRARHPPAAPRGAASRLRRRRAMARGTCAGRWPSWSARRRSALRMRGRSCASWTLTRMASSPAARCETSSAHSMSGRSRRTGYTRVWTRATPSASGMVPSCALWARASTCQASRRRCSAWAARCAGSRSGEEASSRNATARRTTRSAWPTSSSAASRSTRLASVERRWRPRGTRRPGLVARGRRRRSARRRRHWARGGRSATAGARGLWWLRTRPMCPRRRQCQPLGRRRPCRSPW